MNFKELEKMHQSLQEKHPNPRPGQVERFPVLQPASFDLDHSECTVSECTVKTIAWRYDYDGWSVDDEAHGSVDPVRFSWSHYRKDEGPIGGNLWVFRATLSCQKLGTLSFVQAIPKRMASGDALDYMEREALHDISDGLAQMLLECMRKAQKDTYDADQLNHML